MSGASRLGALTSQAILHGCGLFPDAPEPVGRWLVVESLGDVSTPVEAMAAI
jgi:hypothetical protein